MSEGEQMRFDGQVAVITGGGGGIGGAHARLLASRGARVLVNDAEVAPDGSKASDGPSASRPRPSPRTGRRQSRDRRCSARPQDLGHRGRRGDRGSGRDGARQ